MSTDVDQLASKDIQPPDQLEGNVVDEKAIRARAARRRWICPGAGLAYVGGGTAATITFLSSVWLSAAVIWLCLQPNPVSFWIAVAAVIMAGVLQWAEGRGIKRTVLGAPRPWILVNGFVMASCLRWTIFLFAAGLLLTSFGSIKMAGSGMSPTMMQGDRLIYHKRIHSQTVKPGVVVVYRNGKDAAWGKPGWLMVSRVLASPGDTLSILDGRYVVNGKPGTTVGQMGQYEPVIDVPTSPAVIVVPEGCHFVTQDSPSSSYDSRVLSWVREENLVSARLWYQKREGILRPVR